MEKLKPLLEYQEIDIELKKISLRLNKDPNIAALEKVRSEFNSARQAMNTQEEFATSLLSQMEQIKKYSDENNQKLKEYMAELAKVDEDDLEKKKEIIAGIEDLRDKTASLEKKIDDKQKKGQKAINEYLKAKELGGKKKEQFSKLKAEVDKTSGAKQPKIDELTKRLNDKKKEIDKTLFSEYEKLVANGKFPPVVEANPSGGGKNYNCAGCGMEVSQSTKFSLEKDGLVNCDNCRRLIYIRS